MPAKFLTIALIASYISMGVSNTDKLLKTHRSYSRIEPGKGFYSINESDNEKDIDEYLKSIEKIPDQLQDIVNDHGGRVMFYEKGEKMWPASLDIDPDKCDGFFVEGTIFPCLTAGMFVKCAGENKSESNIALHEYGHAINSFAGKELFGKSLSEDPAVTRMFERDKPRLRKHIQENAKEYVADTVELYYRTEGSKKYLKQQFPERYEWFEGIEEKAVKRGITDGPSIIDDAFGILDKKFKIIDWLNK